MSEPTFDELFPGFEATAELLTLVFAEDYDGVERFRDSMEGDWWNVTLTLAYLLRGVFAGQPETLRLLASMLDDADADRHREPS